MVTRAGGLNRGVLLWLADFNPIELKRYGDYILRGDTKTNRPFVEAKLVVGVFPGFDPIDRQRKRSVITDQCVFVRFFSGANFG